MFRLITSVLFICLCSLAYGQSESVEFNIDIQVPPFGEWSDHESILQTPDGYTLIEKIDLPGPGEVESSLVNPDFFPVSISDDSWIKGATLHSELRSDRGIWTAVVSIPLLKYDNSSWLQLSKTILKVNFTLKDNIIETRGPFKSESILADGLWYKIATQERGIYKVTKQWILDQDIDQDQLNPKTFKIYGNGGGTLPEKNNAERIDDLEEIAIKFIGDNDDIWDDNEYFLFYAESPDDLRFNTVTKSILVTKNTYSFNNHYFIRLDGNETKLINSKEELSPVDRTTEYARDMQHIEDALYNVIDYRGSHGSGKSWLGDLFTTSSPKNYENQFDLTDYKIGSEVNIRARLAAASTAVGSRWEFNFGNYSADENIVKVDQTTNVVGAAVQFNNFSGSTISENGNIADIQIRFRPINGQATGWLDYIQVEGDRKIKLNNLETERHLMDITSTVDQTTEYHIESNGSEQFNIWSLNNPQKPVELSLSNSVGQQSWKFKGSDYRSFILFDLNKVARTPEFVSELNNQNLHSYEKADMLVVYHRDFENSATRIAQHRRDEGLNVKTVLVDNIFNEFSGGSPDVTGMRDFFRMMYERDPNFNYVLLVGDGSFDHRHIKNDLEFQNFIPTYQTTVSYLSYRALDAYPSDDFFALLDDNEGNMNLTGGLDIAVGRFPISTDNEGQALIDKIISYETQKEFLGNWRRKITIVADDQDDNLHFNHTEQISSQILRDHPDVIVDKIILDAFEEVPNSGGDRYPEVNEAIQRNYSEGQLILNYIGHGSSSSLSQERVITAAEVEEWIQQTGLPIFFTATCSFTSYDDPKERSAGEMSLLKPGGGVVCLLSTVRIVFAHANRDLALSMYREILKLDNGKQPRIGEVVRKAKNAGGDTNNNRKFSIFGDPAMKVPLPEYGVRLNTLNGQSISSFRDTLGALGQVSLEGDITLNGEVLNDFNGILDLTFLDKPAKLKTRGQAEDSQVAEFEIQKTALFKGRTRVTNGKWSLDFTIPADINYEYGEGKLLMYASDTDMRDASGVTDGIIIGGTSKTPVQDDLPPVVLLKMDRLSFESGDETGTSPLLLADFEDDYGINTTGIGLGHDIVAILDGDLENKIVLNSLYKSSLDDSTNGSVRYRFNDLTLGRHTLTVRAWDVANNVGESTIEFVVTENAKYELTDVTLYPNPLSGFGTFSFTHNLPVSSLDVAIDFYDAAGKHITRYETTTVSNIEGRVSSLRWDTDVFKSYAIPSGIYFYKITASANTTNSSRSFFAESTSERMVYMQ